VHPTYPGILPLHLCVGCRDVGIETKVWVWKGCVDVDGSDGGMMVWGVVFFLCGSHSVVQFSIDTVVSREECKRKRELVWRK
jgi:hypothetical protein